MCCVLRALGAMLATEQLPSSGGAAATGMHGGGHAEGLTRTHRERSSVPGVNAQLCTAAVQQEDRGAARQGGRGGGRTGHARQCAAVLGVCCALREQAKGRARAHAAPARACCVVRKRKGRDSSTQHRRDTE